MKKKYIVELTEDERSALQEIVKKLKGTSQKVKRANILLKADVGGPDWTDARIAEALDCRTKTVENVRQRFVELGFDVGIIKGDGKVFQVGSLCISLVPRPVFRRSR